MIKGQSAIASHHQDGASVAISIDQVEQPAKMVLCSQLEQLVGEKTSEQIIRGPLDYLLLSPGKDMRRKLMLAFNEWLHVPPEKVEVINEIVNLLHTASLLIDDIQDSSKLRRGSPVAHSIFGIAQTINSANYAYFLAQEKLSALNSTQANKVFIEELMNLHRGQGMDLYWRDMLLCPSEEEYLTMVMNKTGGLFRLTVKLMQLESNCQSDCILLAEKLGIIFQIRDDILNIKASSYAKNKGFCEDITEGKFSFPVIHSVNSNPMNLQLLNILKQRSEDKTLKLYAVDYITSTNSFTYSYQKLDMYLAEATALVEAMNGEMGISVGMVEFLDVLRHEGAVELTNSA